MSQQHGFFSHPPPPSSTASSRGNTVPHLVQQRRQPGPAQPPSITTNFLQTQGVGSQAQTPASALTPGHSTWSYSPATPSVAPSWSSRAGYPDASHLLSPSRAHLQSPGSPSMAQQPYNPRQWSGHGSHLAYAQQPSPLSRAAAEVTGMEAAMPSPPPPYSPETHNIAGASQTARPSPMVEQIGFVSSPLAAESTDLIMASTSLARHSPQHPQSPAFPPPPGQSSRTRERSASGQRLLNTIHSLTGRGKQPVSHDLPTSQSVHYPSGSESFRAPAARRAASTGHIFPAIASSSSSPHRAIALNASGRTSPEGSSWHPGMPLPGPPPGPPPPGTRSQSLNRFPASVASYSTTSGNDLRHLDSANPDHNAPTPPQRRAAAQASTLGPVPPTPADWNDADDLETAIRSIEKAHGSNVSSYQPLRIDTGTYGDSLTSQGGRNPHRDASADGNGIRERRSKSRTARELENASTCSSNVMSPASDNVRPKDFVSSSTLQSSISQRRENMRKISGYASISAVPPDPSSMQTTSRSIQNVQSVPQATSILTPPYTPAVGSQGGEGPQRRALAGPLSASSDRSMPRLMHASTKETATMPATSSPARPSSSTSKFDTFYQQAIERHYSLVQKESAATSDEERLEIFASFLVHESRLRRDRYQAAYNNMAGDVMDMTRDMWRSYSNGGKRAITPSTSMSSTDPTISSWASDGGLASAQGAMPSSASSIGEFTPATDTASFGDSAELLDRSDSRQWGEQFKPSLSPIPSMAVSTVPDEDSSRGRTASRWWEQSDTGSVGRPDRMEKSHCETKYMGVTPASLRDDQPQPSPEAMRSSPSAGLTNVALGPDEYPAEKTGWHEQSEFNTPMATPSRPGESRKSSNASGQVNELDVSRLVTLPPPFPRHHPAVNNNHPRLSELRNAHRQLASQTEIQQIRDAYLDQDWALQRSHQEETKKRRNRLRTSIQEKLNTGSISFADAARAETTFEASEAEHARLAARATFDAYEQAISHPLNALLTSRLAQAETSITALLADLSPSTAPNPSQAQEEGDEHPERLEKLTLLKWLFEAREQLHKEMADLHAQRADTFAPVVLAPYRRPLHQQEQAKIAEAQAFFARDRAARAASYAREALARISTLHAIVELNVARGLEDQLSAFWDIAPGLLEIINAVPRASDASALALLRIRIPAEEICENPALRRWPLQYLYSLLAHAGKSARQFVEAQVNLLCLLHEVRGARARAALVVRRCEAVERERCERESELGRRESEQGGRESKHGGRESEHGRHKDEVNSSSRVEQEEEVHAEGGKREREREREREEERSKEAELEGEMARAEEERLDCDLKEKVGEVERQWREALGDGLEACKDGVRAWLVEDGGWVEGLED